MEIIKAARPPRGLTRMLFRLPIQLYRMRLGRLLGGRVLLLTHTGRRSGKRRHMVVEVVTRTPDGGYIVASGFGTAADWYRNVLHTPQVTIQVGDRVLRATAEPIPVAEAEDVMAHYGSRHPLTAKLLCRYLMGLAVDGSEADFRAVGRHLPFVRFTPS